MDFQVSVKDVFHYAEVDFLSFLAILPKEYNFMKSQESRNKAFRIIFRKMLIVHFQESFEILKLFLLHRFKYKLSISCIIKETSTLATRTQFSQTLEITTKEMTNNIMWT